MSDETTTTTWSDLIAGIRRLGIAGDSMPLRRKIVPDDSQPVPTCGGRVMDRAVMTRSWLCSCGREVTDEFFEDAAIVPKFDHVAPHVEDGSFRGEWREPWPSAAGGPMHVLSAPILMCGICGKSAGAGDACQHCGAILMKWGPA